MNLTKFYAQNSSGFILQTAKATGILNKIN